MVVCCVVWWWWWLVVVVVLGSIYMGHIGPANDRARGNAKATHGRRSTGTVNRDINPNNVHTIVWRSVVALSTKVCADSLEVVFHLSPFFFLAYSHRSCPAPAPADSPCVAPLLGFSHKLVKSSWPADEPPRSSVLWLIQ